MAIAEIRAAAPADAERCAAVLTLAFGSDPVCRWAWPDASRYLEAFPRFVRAFGGAAFAAGTAYCVGDGCGVALWLPPGASPDEESLTSLIQQTAPAAVQDALFSMFEQMAGYHPKEPHWHLPLMGVEPGRQGCGCGSALLEDTLAECDRLGMPVYLEATSPRNVPLYERHGFVAVGEIQAATSPPLTPMVRRPRRAA